MASWDHAKTLKAKARFEELCGLLPENHRIGMQADKALILKALG
jgi:hypothetical protein